MLENLRELENNKFYFICIPGVFNEERKSYYGHWVLMYRINEIITYFDSLGSNPVDIYKTKEIKGYKGKFGNKQQIRECLDKYKGYFLDDYNVKLQDEKSNKCGYYCIYRIIKRNKINKEFIEEFNKNGGNDEMLINKLMKKLI